jgi:hypothetical protein
MLTHSRGHRGRVTAAEWRVTQGAAALRELPLLRRRCSQLRRRVEELSSASADAAKSSDRSAAAAAAAAEARAGRECAKAEALQTAVAALQAAG